MPLEESSELHLVNQEKYAQANNTSDKNYQFAGQENLILKIEPKIMELVNNDDFELEPEEIFQKYGLNPVQAKLFIDIFKAFDEGTNECILHVMAIRCGQKLFHKICSFEKG